VWFILTPEHSASRVRTETGVIRIRPNKRARYGITVTLPMAADLATARAVWQAVWLRGVTGSVVTGSLIALSLPAAPIHATPPFVAFFVPRVVVYASSQDFVETALGQSYLNTKGAFMPAFQHFSFSAHCVGARMSLHRQKESVSL
jgi:hypothetical protein